MLASFTHLHREYNTRTVAYANAPPTNFKLFEANTRFLHSSLQGRVLFSVFFGIIVLGLGLLKCCDPSACKGMSAREYSYIHNAQSSCDHANVQSQASYDNLRFSYGRCTDSKITRRVTGWIELCSVQLQYLLFQCQCQISLGESYVLLEEFSMY